MCAVADDSEGRSPEAVHPLHIMIGKRKASAPMPTTTMLNRERRAALQYRDVSS